MDADAFDDYFEQRYPALVGHVAAMCGNRDLAAEAVQEALVRAWARRGSFGRHPNKDAWIRTVARNLLIDGWRRDRRHVPLDTETTFEAPDAADKLALHRSLQALPEKHRRALVLYYLADLPVESIASELGCTAGTVRMWLSRGRDRLGVLPADTDDIARTEVNHA